MPENQYLIHNTTRDVTTRFMRRAAPEPPRMTLMLGGGSVRVIRNRPQVVTEGVVRRMLPELLPLELAGRLKLTNLAGLRVDLTTFKVVEAPAVSPPLPHPPVDSAANDKNQGVGNVILKHGDPHFVPLSVELPLPAVARGLAGGPVEEPASREPLTPPEEVAAEPPVEEPPELPADLPEVELPEVQLGEASLLEPESPSTVASLAASTDKAPEATKTSQQSRRDRRR
jgi:hypothetical protein